MITRKTDAVPGLPSLHGRSDGEDRAGRAVAGPKRELPVRQVRVLQPLMRTGVDGQFRTRTNRADFGRDKELIGCRRGQLHFADLNLVRLGDDDLTRAHSGSLWISCQRNDQYSKSTANVPAIERLLLEMSGWQPD